MTTVTIPYLLIDESENSHAKESYSTLHRYDTCLSLKNNVYRGYSLIDIIDSDKFDDYWRQHYVRSRTNNKQEFSKIDLLNIRLCNFCSYMYGGNRKD